MSVPKEDMLVLQRDAFTRLCQETAKDSKAIIRKLEMGGQSLSGDASKAETQMPQLQLTKRFTPHQARRPKRRGVARCLHHQHQRLDSTSYLLRHQVGDGKQTRNIGIVH